MSRERIPSERPDGVVDVATVPDGWLVDDAWRPGETWLSPILEADPEAWAARLSQIGTDVQTQLAERNAGAKLGRLSNEEFDEYQQWRIRALALMRKVHARGRHAQLVRKQVRIATSTDDVRLMKSMLWHAIKDHKAAAEAGDFEPEPHDLALWAHVEDM